MGSFNSLANGRILLEEFDSLKLSDEFLDEEAWIGMVVEAVSRLAGKFELRGETVFVLPGYQLLTKRIKVPKVDPKWRRKAIAYEVEQSLPYALAEVDYDTDVISDDGIEEEVLVVAQRRATTDLLFEALAGLKVVPARLLASPVLEFNALKAGLGGEGEGTVSLNIGARSSTVSIVDHAGGFIRTVMLGGHTLTEEIAKRLDITSGEAEERKIAIASGGESSLETLDSGVIRDCVNQSGKRIGAEVKRSMLTAKRKMGNLKPSRLCLAGWGSKLPTLAPSLSQDLGLPVTSLNFEGRLECRDDTVSDRWRRSLLHDWEIMGQVDSQGRQDGFDIDLLPPRFRSARVQRRRRLGYLAAAGFLFAACLIPLLYFRGQSVHHAIALPKVSDALRSVEELHRVQRLRLEEVGLLDERLRSLERLLHHRTSWIAFFSDLQDRLVEVEDVWLDRFAMRTVVESAKSGESAFSDGPAGMDRAQIRLQVSGRMLDRMNPLEKVSQNLERRVNEMLDTLALSKFVIEVQNERFDISERGILKFDFDLLLDPDHPL